LLVLASLPTAMVWMLLAQDASNIPLYTASLLFVLPAVAAAFWAWRARAQDFDPVPLSRFLRGYRLNVLDSLKIGVPGVVVLTVMTRALSSLSTFSFRFVDVLRLSVFTLLTMPLRTLSMLSLWVLMAGISVLVGDYAFLFTASLLTLTMYHSERPVISRIRGQFVSDPEE